MRPQILSLLFLVFFCLTDAFASDGEALKRCSSGDLNRLGISSSGLGGRVRRIVPVVRKRDLNPKPVLGHVVVSGASCDVIYFDKTTGTTFTDLAGFQLPEGLPCSEHMVSVKVGELVSRAYKKYEGANQKNTALLNAFDINKKWVSDFSNLVCDDLADHENGLCSGTCRTLYEKNPDFYCQKTLPVLLSVNPNSRCKACCEVAKDISREKISKNTGKKKNFRFADLFDRENSIAPERESKNASPSPGPSAQAQDSKAPRANTLRPMRKLKEALRKYQLHLKSSEFELASKYIPSALLKKWGGASGYKKLMTEVVKEAKTSQGVDLLQLTLHAPGAIQEGEKIWVSVVPTEFPISKAETTGWLFASLIAISENKGTDWTFVDVGKEARALLTQLDPKVLKKISFPKRKMLTQKGTVKTYQIQTEGKWKPVSEREFYLDLPQRKGVFFEIQKFFKKKKNDT